MRWARKLDARRRRLDAHTRTTLLTGMVASASAALFAATNFGRGISGAIHIDWWLIGLVSIAAELMIFNVEFRREVYTFTFSEIPLVFGVFLASPMHLVLGRLAGEAIFLIAKERQPPRKLFLNLSSFFGECVVLLSVFQLLGGQRSLDDPTMWPRAVVAICCADLLGFVVVASAVRWHGGGALQFRSILSVGALTVPVNTSLALLAALLFVDQPWGLVLLVGLALFLVATYRSYSSLTTRFESLAQLYDFTRLVSGSQRPDVVLESILGKAKDLFRAERAEIWLSDGSGGVVGLAVDDDGRRSTDVPAEAFQAICSAFEQSREALVIVPGRHDDGPTSIAAALRATDCIVAPITDAGDVVGLVAVVDRIGDTTFALEEAPMFATLANHASVALENGRLIVRLHEHARQREHDASHDALTGLPNRVLFGARLSDALDRMPTDVTTVAVALMDLDGFKEINDTLGHHAGDAVLVEVAHRLTRVVDASVVVARLGGDEFGLLFTEKPRSILGASVHAVREELALPADIDGVKINVSASIGVATAPEDGRDAAILLQRADVAMYDAKTGTGDGVAFYNPKSDTNSPRRLSLINGLNTAIVNGEMSVVYQPKLSLARSEVVGVESLIRWTHPEFGAIDPAEFVPLAERSGMIQQMTEFVLHAALDQASCWRQAGFDWGVAVNLSMRNLIDSELPAAIGRALQRSGVPPHHLTLEVTESNVMSDPNRTIAVLEELAAYGLRLSIDDFGTGYSSLAYLQRLPVHEVKIDKCFVLAMNSDSGAEAIVRSVIDLARNLSLHSVAEGVEDYATWQRLCELGCEEAQGFFFARPMRPESVLDYAVRLPRLLESTTDPGPMALATSMW